MAKEILFDTAMRDKLVSGIETVATAVASTLGPSGRTVLIEQEFGSTLITKDGVSVAKSIELEDKVENVGAGLIKNIASKTNDQAGDGTTTSTVLAAEMVKEGIKSVRVGVNPIYIKRGIDKAVDDTIKLLSEDSKPITTKEEIAQVASISANDDTTLGNIIADAIEKVGNNGVITVEESQTIDTYVTYVEGMQFDRGYISPIFCNDRENFRVEYSNPYILLYDGSISSNDDIFPVLETVNRKQKPLLIIADDITDAALTTLVMNSARGVIQVCAVKSPGFGDRRKDLMQDLAVLTGAHLISPSAGDILVRATLEDLGTCDNIKVTSKSTTIVGGGGAEGAVEERINYLQKLISTTTSSYDREKLQERLAKLAGGIAVLSVGATTEIELKEKKHRVEDAVNATRASIEEGVVAGGGAELCQISAALAKKSKQFDCEDEKIGYNIVVKALEKPIKQIAENAGMDGVVIADKCKRSKKGTGFDALHNTWCDMVKTGIVDPVRVTKSALTNAASIVALVLTSSAVVTTITDNANDQMIK